MIIKLKGKIKVWGKPEAVTLEVEAHSHQEWELVSMTDSSGHVWDEDVMTDSLKREVDRFIFDNISAELASINEMREER